MSGDADPQNTDEEKSFSRVVKDEMRMVILLGPEDIFHQRQRVQINYWQPLAPLCRCRAQTGGA